MPVGRWAGPVRSGLGLHLVRLRQVTPGHPPKLADVRQAVAAATAIGDDRLQKASRGTVVPDSFTHGSSADRVKWLQTGLKSGQVDSCNTFAR